jgi:hypothetical protein
MALSDQLTRLAARAKQLEDRAAAATTQAKADLERNVDSARASAKAQAETLRKSAEAVDGKVSDWWTGAGKSWNEHVSAVRKNVDDKKAAHDFKVARRTADQAEADASFAIDYAYAAIEEAEYAVLDAALAQMEADELAEV